MIRVMRSERPAGLIYYDDLHPTRHVTSYLFVNDWPILTIQLFISEIYRKCCYYHFGGKAKTNISILMIPFR